MSLPKEWFGEPDQFDWVSKFLRDRGLLGSARVLMAVVAVSSALTPISALTRMPPGTANTLAVGIVGAAFCVLMTWFWMTRWPTRRQSLVSVVLGIGCVAAWSLTQSSAAVAALACTAMAVTGGYVAFFHNARVLLFNTVVALAVSIVAVYRLAGQTDVATAVAAFWLIWLLIVAIPLAIRGMSKAMGQFAMRSDEDPLTGLLNRRGFVDVVCRRLVHGARRGTDRHLTVMMIDLDDFKVVNDTYGHAAGDRMLLRVADLLREHVPADAALCRCGGEEFLVAMTSSSGDVAAIARQLCEAIRTHGGDVSASIGAAGAEIPRVGADDAVEFIDRLVHAADLAMYAAKRDGGNRVQLADDPLP